MNKNSILFIFVILFLVCSMNVFATTTGGTITTDGNYTIHTFTSNGTFNTTQTLTGVSILVVAGGGGGGTSNAGGGGAGGVVYTTTGTIIAGSFNVVIGAGGIGGAQGTDPGTPGTKGSNSSFSTYIAEGGGGGGSGSGLSYPSCTNGGSGGGSQIISAGKWACNGTATQGYNGGYQSVGYGAPYAGGGGGGAGSVGGDASPGSSNGGVGVNYSINGSIVCYAGGGSGGGNTGNGTAVCGGGIGANGNQRANNGTANTGGGGGGGGVTSGSTTMGGNGGSGIVIIRYPNIQPNVTFANQNPSDITATTLFNPLTPRVNITYTYINALLDNSTVFLGLGFNSTVFSCIQYLNGSCVWFNNNFGDYRPIFNITDATYTNYTFSLGENDIYPYISNRPGTTFLNNVHSNITLLNTNSLSVTKFNNLSSNISYLIYEVMSLSSGQSKNYICNTSGFNESSNSFTSTIQSNSNCLEIGFCDGTYNHNHNANSSHCVNSMSITNGRFINGLGLTSSMYFVNVGQNGQTTNIGYVNSFTSSSTTKTCSGAGVTCTNQTYTIDSHLHFYGSNTEQIKNYAKGTYNGTEYDTAILSEIIEVSGLSPQPPIITNPFDTIQSTRYMNITYLNATSTNPLATISYYNISLLNSDLSFNRTISNNNGLNNSYYWDIYSQNLSIKDYFVRVTAYNSLGVNASDIEMFNLTKNANLNVSVFNFTGGAVSGFNYYLLDLTSGISVYNSTSNSSTNIDIIFGHSYSLIVGSSIIANTTTNFTSSTYFTYINVTAYPYNSIKVSAFLESDNSIVNINASILFFGTLSSFTRTLNASNSTYYPLDSDTYTITVTSSGYATRSYVVTVSNASSQLLNIYMLPSNSTSIIGIYTKDLSDNILPNSIIQVQQLVNTSYLGIAQGITDGNGFITFSLQEGKTYRLIISADNFNIFQINFVPYSANSPYTFKLSPSSSFVYHTLTDYMSYSYSPISNTLNQTNNVFSLTTYSANGSMIYQFINCSGYVHNVSGTPTGTTVSVNLNVTEGQTVSCLYGFNVVGYGYYSFIVNYNRLTSSATDIKASALIIKNSTETVWLTLLSFIIMLLVAMGIKQRFPDIRITGAIFCVGTIVFVALGWINMVSGGVSATIGLLLLYMGSR